MEERRQLTGREVALKQMLLPDEPEQRERVRALFEHEYHTLVQLKHPRVVTAFAEKVGSERRLAALYLLTVADIRGTSPRVWNAWKAKLLEDLFHATGAVLRGLFAEGTRPSSEDVAARIGFEPLDTRPLVQEQLATS